MPLVITTEYHKRRTSDLETMMTNEFFSLFICIILMKLLLREMIPIVDSVKLIVQAYTNMGSAFELENVKKEFFSDMWAFIAYWEINLMTFLRRLMRMLMKRNFQERNANFIKIILKKNIPIQLSHHTISSTRFMFNSSSAKEWAEFRASKKEAKASSTTSPASHCAICSCFNAAVYAFVKSNAINYHNKNYKPYMFMLFNVSFLSCLFQISGW